MPPCRTPRDTLKNSDRQPFHFIRKRWDWYQPKRKRRTGEGSPLVSSFSDRMLWSTVSNAFEASIKQPYTTVFLLCALNQKVYPHLKFLWVSAIVCWGCSASVFCHSQVYIYIFMQSLIQASMETNLLPVTWCELSQIMGAIRKSLPRTWIAVD